MAGEWVEYEEVWDQIPDFPNYAVSNFGRVMRIGGHVLKVTPNQMGIAKIGLMSEGKQHSRSVAVLVANAFLGHLRNEIYDTPINLDGDRMNNRVTNLMWRPRWYAYKYHGQFRNPLFYAVHAPLEDLDSGEVYDNLRELCVANGLYFNDVLRAMIEDKPVILTHQRFAWADDVERRKEERIRDIKD